jgi:hypothetical protein
MSDASATAVRAELTGRILGFAVSQAIYAAAALGIPDLLAGGPRLTAELADAAGAHPHALYRLLRMLASHGIFVEEQDGRFANSASSELLREVPGSLRALAVAAGEDGYPALAATRRMVESGEPAFEIAFGAVWEEHLARDPAANERFNRLVAARKEQLAELLADRAWRGDETIVDVGAGDGALLQALLRRRPGLRGIAFDLPEVATEAAVRISAAGLAGRCQIVAGSFFRDVPAGGDVYVLSDVLHRWGDECARQILAAVRRAIPAHGSLLLAEEALAQPNRSDGKLMDVLMMAIGGAERTEAQWRALLADAGFTLARIPPGHGSVRVLEAAPTVP